MARIRTINQAYNLIKFDDPETAITEHLIRKFIIEGKIPAFKTGAKYLIDVDILLSHIYYMAGNKQ